MHTYIKGADAFYVTWDHVSLDYVPIYLCWNHLPAGYNTIFMLYSVYLW